MSRILRRDWVFLLEKLSVRPSALKKSFSIAQYSTVFVLLSSVIVDSVFSVHYTIIRNCQNKKNNFAQKWGFESKERSVTYAYLNGMTKKPPFPVIALTFVIALTHMHPEDVEPFHIYRDGRLRIENGRTVPILHRPLKWILYITRSVPHNASTS